MFEGVQHDVPFTVDQRLERRALGDRVAQRHRIHVKPNLALETSLESARERRADDAFALRRWTLDQDAHERQQGHEWSHASMRAPAFDARAQLRTAFEKR